MFIRLFILLLPIVYGCHVTVPSSSPDDLTAWPPRPSPLELALTAWTGAAQDESTLCLSAGVHRLAAPIRLGAQHAGMTLRGPDGDSSDPAAISGGVALPSWSPCEVRCAM